MNDEKRLNAVATEKRICQAIETLQKKGIPLTVRSVARQAGISPSTAYAHGCREKILKIINMD